MPVNQQITGVFIFDFFIIRSTRPLAKAFELTGFAAPVFQNRKINK